MGKNEVLVRQLVTEKSTTLLAADTGYAFEVRLSANKIEIGNAIESFYGVKVADVRTLVVRGKTRRFGKNVGKRKNWKKAYVTLADGNSIPLFEG